MTEDNEVKIPQDHENYVRCPVEVELVSRHTLFGQLAYSAEALLMAHPTGTLAIFEGPEDRGSACATILVGDPKRLAGALRKAADAMDPQE